MSTVKGNTEAFHGNTSRYRHENPGIGLVAPGNCDDAVAAVALSQIEHRRQYIVPAHTSCISSMQSAIKSREMSEYLGGMMRAYLDVLVKENILHAIAAHRLSVTNHRLWYQKELININQII